MIVSTRLSSLRSTNWLLLQLRQATLLSSPVLAAACQLHEYQGGEKQTASLLHVIQLLVAQKATKNTAVVFSQDSHSGPCAPRQHKKDSPPPHAAL
jgi:hypothetical protein